MINALIFFLLSPAFSQTNTITNFSISGASKTYENTTAPLYEAWGGVVDSADCSSTSNTTCDTCGTGPFNTVTESCNTKAVGENATLSFTFRSGKNVVGDFIITEDTDTSAAIATTVDVAANTNGTVTVNWKDLCNAFDTNASADCSTAGSQIYRIGLNTNKNDDNYLVQGTDDYVRVLIGVQPVVTTNVEKSTDCTADTTVPGICDYSLFRGDEKAYFSTYNYTNGFPTINSVRYSAIRTYYAAGTCAAVSNFDHGTYAEFSLSKSNQNFTASISGDGVINGLVNGTTYCVRTAIVDKAGNVTGFASMATLSSDHEVTPEEVNGLLEDGNCFIATAAYGSPLDERIDTFRKFRDDILLQFSIGKKLVKMYYQYSKPLAVTIFERPWLQTIAQVLLWPLWFAIEILFNYPIVLILLGCTLIFTGLRRRENVI